MKNYPFFHLPNSSVVPLIPKVGCASLHRNIFKHNVKNKLKEKIRFLKRTHNNQKCLFPVRDVFERFSSAEWQVNKGKEKISVNEILDGLEGGTYNNYHFKPQSEILEICKGCESVTFYRFPEEFDKMLMDGGIDPCGEISNKSNNKPELTPEQRERVQALYSEDIALLESLPIT